MVIAYTCAKPQFVAPFAYSAYSAPLVSSSAVVSREFHGNTSPYVAAAYPYAAGSYVASPYTAAYASPYAAAYTSPVLFR